MLRLLTRFVGLLLLAGGFIALIVDGTRSIAGGRLLVTSLRRGAAELFPAYSQAIAANAEASVLWRGLAWLMTMLPISIAFGGLGALLILLSHKQDAPISFRR